MVARIMPARQICSVGSFFRYDEPFVVPKRITLRREGAIVRELFNLGNRIHNHDKRTNS